MQALMCCHMSNCMQRKSILLGEANLASEQEVAPGSLKIGYELPLQRMELVPKLKKAKWNYFLAYTVGLLVPVY